MFPRPLTRWRAYVKYIGLQSTVLSVGAVMLLPMRRILPKHFLHSFCEPKPTGTLISFAANSDRFCLHRQKIFWQIIGTTTRPSDPAEAITLFRSIRKPRKRFT